MNFDPDELGLAFEHPSEVVNDPDLTINEKRAMLRGVECLCHRSVA